MILTEESNGILIHSQKHRQTRWAEQFPEQFSQHTVTVGLQVN